MARPFELTVGWKCVTLTGAFKLVDSDVYSDVSETSNRVPSLCFPYPPLHALLHVLDLGTSATHDVTARVTIVLLLLRLS